VPVDEYREPPQHERTAPARGVKPSSAHDTAFSPVTPKGILARSLKERDRPQFAVISIAVILEQYLHDRREPAVPGADRLGWAHKPLARLLGMQPPEAIAEGECRRYMPRRRRESIADTTIRTELQALRAAPGCGARASPDGSGAEDGHTCQARAPCPLADPG
jgi:hypothetical protein